MVIETSEGTFGSFRDIKAHMRHEHLDSIEILFVSYWGVPVLSKGTYTLQDICFIIDAE